MPAGLCKCRKPSRKCDPPNGEAAGFAIVNHGEVLGTYCSLFSFTFILHFSSFFSSYFFDFSDFFFIFSSFFIFLLLFSYFTFLICPLVEMRHSLPYGLAVVLAEHRWFDPPVLGHCMV